MLWWALGELLGGLWEILGGQGAHYDLGPILCYLLLWAQARFPEGLPLETSSQSLETKRDVSKTAPRRPKMAPRRPQDGPKGP